MDWWLWRGGVVDSATAVAVVEGRPRRAGVSSFGISGTNAHVILEQAPMVAPVVSGGGSGDSGAVTVGLSVAPWVLSAKSVEALAGQAERLLQYVGAHRDLDVLDVGLSLAGRSVFEHRAVVVGADREELLAGVSGLAQGRPGGAVVSGQRPGAVGKTVLVFPGSGFTVAGDGPAVVCRFPVFAEPFDAVVQELDGFLRLSLRSVCVGWG